MRKSKNSYFVNVCRSSKIMSHPGHLQAPRPYFEYCWWLATSEANAGFMCSALKLPAKKFLFKSFKSRLADTGGWIAAAADDDWLAPVKRLFKFKVISSRRKLMMELRNWLMQFEGLSLVFGSICFAFGLSFLTPFTWFSLRLTTDGDPSRWSHSRLRSSFSFTLFDVLSLWLLLLLLSFFELSLSPLISLPLSNRCPFESVEWILWLLSSPQYSLQCERSGKGIQVKNKKIFLIMKIFRGGFDGSSLLIKNLGWKGALEILSFLITFAARFALIIDSGWKAWQEVGDKMMKNWWTFYKEKEKLKDRKNFSVVLYCERRRRWWRRWRWGRSLRGKSCLRIWQKLLKGKISLREWNQD